MKSYTYLFGLLLSIAALSTACQDKIELDLPEGEILLVTQGWLTNEDRPHHFSITTSQPYFDDSTPPAVSGAGVLLRDSEGTETPMTETSQGIYTYPTGGEVGHSYQLDISLADGTHYLSAFELLTPPVEIAEINWIISEREPSELLDEDPEQIYSVTINTFEPAGFGDYYRWRLIVNGDEKTLPENLNISSDEFVDGNPIINYEPFFELFFPGDTVTIIQERISEDAYAFLLLVQAQTAFVGGPFDTPPAPIPGNVQNVADPSRNSLGFVGTAARSTATVVVGEE